MIIRVKTTLHSPCKFKSKKISLINKNKSSVKKHKPIRWEYYVAPAAATVSEASVNFSFASPAPEDVTNGTMEGVPDPQPSPENLRQHQDQSFLNISHNEDVVREDATEPSQVLFEETGTKSVLVRRLFRRSSISRTFILAASSTNLY